MLYAPEYFTNEKYGLKEIGVIRVLLFELIAGRPPFKFLEE